MVTWVLLRAFTPKHQKDLLLKVFVHYKSLLTTQSGINTDMKGYRFGTHSPPLSVHMSICYFSSTLSAFFQDFYLFIYFFFLPWCFSCAVKNHGGKMLLFRDDGEFFPFVLNFCVWPVAWATVNIVAMVTAAKEAKTYHVIEVYGAV